MKEFLVERFLEQAVEIVFEERIVEILVKCLIIISIITTSIFNQIINQNYMVFWWLFSRKFLLCGMNQANNKIIFHCYLVFYNRLIKINNIMRSKSIEIYHDLHWIAHNNRLLWKLSSRVENLSQHLESTYYLLVE